MRRRRHRASAISMMGDGTSFEEVLTVITVLLLLRVVFMVPMVNLDKAKTVAAIKGDRYWATAIERVFDAPASDASARPYRAAFGIRSDKVVVSQDARKVIVEAISPDSSLLVIRHNPDNREFVAMRVQAGGSARSFRRGRLLWSQAEQEWFVGADTVDYGSHPTSVSMEKDYRTWTKRERGY
jgi:hypothetical protein